MLIDCDGCGQSLLTAPPRLRIGLAQSPGSSPPGPLLLAGPNVSCRPGEGLRTVSGALVRVRGTGVVGVPAGVGGHAH
ncbi:hypothetical protein, partial [Nonomuraea angiospora]|uniref:hypothetical protein n=1 Tax=Nonomuraea angiospora TaxID=46172 RepID=UPI0029B88751